MKVSISVPSICLLLGLAPLAPLAPLATAQAPTPGEVLDEQSIDKNNGGFTGALGYLDELGISVTALGDLNGDGVQDLAAGTASIHFDVFATGDVWVMLLNADGTVKQNTRIAGGLHGLPPALATDDLLFGASVAGLGDLNGDGIGDLAVGAPLEEPSGTYPGTVWILFLNVDGSVKGFQEISDGVGGFGSELDGYALFGWSLAALGDLDGDGLSELAVGTPVGPAGRAVWILFLAADGTVRHHTRLDGLDTDAIAGLGHLDGDGVRDMAVGSELGRVTMVFLNADGSIKGSQLIADGVGGFTGTLDPSDQFGAALARTGDLDGDGIRDLAVGAPNDRTSVTPELFLLGAAWILFMNQDGTVHGQQKISPAGFGITIFEEPAVFGRSLAGLGDLNGDLKSDLAVGAPFNWQGGALWVLFLDGEPQPPAAAVPYGCGINPVDSLGFEGLPEIGATVTVGIDNPLGTQAPGSLPMLGLAFAPAPGFPCGTLLPSFGMLGQNAVGELLLGGPPRAPLLFFGSPWLGAGQPAEVPLWIPPDGGLVGVQLYVQGLLFDPAPAAPVPLGLTDALALRIGVAD